MKERDQIIRRLKENYLFASLPADVLDKVIAQGRVAWVEDGKILFRKGDPGDFFFCVLEGMIQIRVDAMPGKVHLMNRLGAGAVFGEVALLDGGPRTADAVAEGPTCLFILSRADFQLVLVEQSRMEEQLIRLLCERVRWISEQVEQKNRAELELRKLTQAIEHSPSMILLTDQDGAIQYANPRFCQETGWPLNEILGKTPSILKAGTTPAETYRDLWKTIASGKDWRGEILNRRRDGSTFWASLSIAPIYDEEAVLTHFVGTLDDITERRRLQDELARLAVTDPLTGLSNRRHFFDVAAALIQQCQTQAKPLGVIMLDLDHFKSINDNFGHAAGDRVLVDLAAILRGLLASDQLLARLGGEEFALLLPGLDLQQAEDLAHALRRGLAQGMAARGDRLLPTITISQGVSICKDGEELVDAALIRADCALYRAKRDGRDCVRSEHP